MLVIRAAQQDQLRQFALNQYVDRTIQQFHQYFPGPCHAVTEEPLRQMVRFGVQRAARHEIHAECNVVLYTTLMLLLGSFFDDDPQYPWAQRVLCDPALKDETARAELVYDESLAYWDQVAGPNSAELIKSLVRTRKLLLIEKDVPIDTAARLHRACPTKAVAIGEAGVASVIQSGKRIATNYHMPSDRDQAIAAMLVFGLGAGFDRDPMHPWASEVLKSDRIAPTEKGERLQQATEAFAERWMTYLRRQGQ